jgi:HEAT repeat protein
MQDARALPHLLNRLYDADLNVRYHVIEALGRIGSADAVEPLLRIVRERDPYLAFAALDALAIIAEPSAMPEVIALIDDPALGTAAIDTLAAVGNEQAAAPLAAALTTAPAPTVICNALARIHDRLQRELGEGELVADLVRAQLDPAAASRLISHIPQATDQELPGVARVLGWVRAPGVENVLCELLRHAPSRKNAQEALIAIGKPAVPHLLRLLQDEAADVRQAVAGVLGQIGAHESVADLSALLPSEEPEVIVTVVAALGSIGSPAAFDALLPLLGHSNAAVRHAAVSAINSIAHPSTAARIVDLLSDRSSLVRECAVRIAGYFGYADCLDRVLALLGDESAHVRRAVAEHLPYYDDGRVIGALDRVLQDPDVSVRAAAARSLAHVDAERGMPLLTQALRDSDGRVRYHAVQTIGTHKLRSFAPALRELLAGDASMPVRIACAIALGELQDKDAAEALKQAALHPEPDLACPALIALSRIPRVELGTVLDDALSSGDPRRQLAAVQAMAGRDQHLEQLKRLAESANHSRVVSAALNALVSSGAGDAIEAVVALSARDDLRAQCTAALAQAAEADVPLLAEALQHSDPRVRAAVVHALARMRRKRATRELSAALDDRDPTVRFAAAQALGRLDML